MKNINHDLIFQALQMYGQREVPGPDSDKEILGMIQKTAPIVKDDSKYAWCGVFLKEISEQCCGPIPEGYQGARKWLNVGEEVTRNPMPGDVVIFWRESKSSWKGHVALYVRETKDKVFVLGGNQDNMVNIKPYAKSRILGIRRLSTVK